MPLAATKKQQMISNLQETIEEQKRRHLKQPLQQNLQ